MYYGRVPAIEAAGSGFPLQSFTSLRYVKGFSLQSLTQFYHK